MCLCSVYNLIVQCLQPHCAVFTTSLCQNCLCSVYNLIVPTLLVFSFYCEHILCAQCLQGQGAPPPHMTCMYPPPHFVRAVLARTRRSSSSYVHVSSSSFCARSACKDKALLLLICACILLLILCAQCLQGQGADHRQSLKDISVPAGTVVCLGFRFRV